MLVALLGLFSTNALTSANPPAPAAPLAGESDCFHLYYKLVTAIEIGDWEDPSMYEAAARATFLQKIAQLQQSIELGHPGCTVQWVPDNNSPDGVDIVIHTVESPTNPILQLVLYSTRVTFKICCPEGAHGPPM